MSIQGLGAVRAYQQAARLPQPSATEAGGFGAMVEGLVANTGASLRTAEQAGAAQVAGKGDLVDVVTAIGAAEVALDTMVAVRDRAVSAYQDIMRMQI
ncbi:flagellar hook-basal body complex protein FliE [Sphingomonas sp. LHG3443-2]|uniref:flagellar hook-basal body complex protein FliE n=1 Tax=Sphingomonas sp. LHG3443-2 TaxID=2804639 RepID=UPI003CEC0794